MELTERSVQEIGKSLLVSLPKKWTKIVNIRKGSKIKMLVSDQGHLSIAPEFAREEKRKEATLSFDEHFQRRFFREYFGGSEKITILLQKEIAENERKDIYAFLKMFMNVQIIEESALKIVAKCFTIDELSIEECLKRMYFLSLNMMDELLSTNDKMKLQEMRDTMTRFYYMLVMQVRWYLAEGKFTKENQIPLIRALDFRMVAEKIQRVGELLVSIDYVHQNMIPLCKAAKSYYAQAVQLFINNEYEKALRLWAEGKSETKKFKTLKVKSAKTKEIGDYQRITTMMEVLRHAREISMFVR